MTQVNILVAASGSALVPSFGETNDELFVLNDRLDMGPLKTDDLSFTAGRQAFWEKIMAARTPVINDLDQLMALSTRLSNGADLQLVFWMSGTSAELCAYYWLLHYLKKHQGRLSIINIYGLPFLNEAGNIYYPASIGDLSARELEKARKLCHVISPATWESEGDEWRMLRDRNAMLRIAENGKKLVAREEDFYDAKILQFLETTHLRSEKPILQQLKKLWPNANDSFLEWRLSLIQSTRQATAPDTREAQAPANQPDETPAQGH